MCKINSKTAKWVDYIKYLGNFLDSALSDKFYSLS